MQKFNYLLKYERYFFLVATLTFLIPVVANKYFMTIDGPAHLYNANLLKQFWFYDKEDLHNFYIINTELNSNWFNHIWYAVVGLFCSASITEKSILIFYIIALPYSFRFLLRSIVSQFEKTIIPSYMIFPFIYSFPFRMGFFNFCVGIPILFCCLGYWYRNKEDYSIKNTIRLMLLTTLLYFSHVFNFVLFGIVVLIIEGTELIKAKTIKTTIKHLKRLFIVTLPAIVFFILFILSNNEYQHQPPKYIAKDILFLKLLQLQPLITLNLEDELPFVNVYFYSIVLLLLFSAFNYFKSRKAQQAQLGWLFSAILVLIIYFLFPDWVSSGGLISVRWLLYFLLLLIAWIGVQQLPWKLMLLPVMAIFISSLSLIKYHYKLSIPFSKDAEEFVDAGKQIEEGKTVLPLQYTNNWIYTNASNYLGVEKNIFVLDNYEPTKPHFPLVWKRGESVYDIMKHYGDKVPQCINIASYEKQTGKRIDYITQWCFNGNTKDSCSENTEAILTNQFDLVYKSPSNKLHLFKRKEK